MLIKPRALPTRGSFAPGLGRFFVLLIFLVLPAPALRATDLAANTANRAADLGSAYQSEKQLFVGQQCIAGTEGTGGVQNATFSFDQSLSQTQASNELGFGVGGRARFGVVEASASAKFMKNSVSDQYSVSAVWLSDYFLPTRRLSNVHKNDIGTTLTGNDERWAETCGDEYVEEITRGGKLFFSIRVEFSSEQEKQSFESHFSLSGPLYSANADLNTASQQFSQNAKITVSAFQIGGDVSKITAIFGSTDTARAGFVQCTLGGFKQCAQVISAALTYATDTSAGFPSQLAPGALPGPAPLIYKTANYKSAGIYPSNYPFLTQAIQEARARLSTSFEDQFALQTLADRLLEAGMGDKQAQVKQQRDIIDSNVAKILQASQICYDTPMECPKTVTALVVQPVDQTAFVLPPLPTAAFRLLTSTKGLWSRKDSTDYMDSDETRTASAGFGGMGLSASTSRRHTIYDLGRTEGASAVLYVEGQSLKQAEFRFENQQIGVIPLLQSPGAFPDKFTPTGVAIVVQTTRSNPGWLDVDIAATRERFASKDLPIGDGVFYILVDDSFGRQTRFDLEYDKWSKTVATSGNTQTTTEDYMTRHRWWEPDGNGLSVFIKDKFTDLSISHFSNSVTR